MNRQYRKIQIVGVLILLFLGSAHAQQGQGKIKELLAKMQKAYHEASYLEFRIAYFYANQGLPDKPIDSILGRVQMDKSRCRMVIDNTELLITDNYSIQVMRPEKTIYLSKPRHSTMIDPVGLIDSVLSHISGVHTTVSGKDGLQTISINFPPGQQYTSVTMVLDEQTGFLKKVSYALHTATLVSQDMIDRPEHPGPYQAEGTVDVIFSGYRTGSFGDAVFDENKFIHKVDSKFEPAERFKDYHIFLASTNL